MPDTDLLTRFLIDGAGVRGAHVRLDDTWRQILDRTDDVASDGAVDSGPAAGRAVPAPIELLGQAAAVAALLTAHVKVEGRLSLQLRGDGALRLLFAECTAAGTLRGIVQVAEPGDAWSIEDELAAEPVPGERPHEARHVLAADGLRMFGDDAVLAITIENPGQGEREPARYQGLVSLDADTLAAALEGYFRQSEQLPTRLLLAADDARVAGLLLQALPGDEGDDDGWHRACALLDTLGEAELLDCPVETVLARLFHEDGVRLLGGKPLQFACSCSLERVTAMLQALGEDEARAAAVSGVAEIRCEFCGQRYHFDADAIGELFVAPASPPEPPPRLQ